MRAYCNLVTMSDLDRVAERLRAAHRITALTGAGVSAASGIPTFRGPDGLWKQVKPDMLASPEAFAHDPKLVWEWYDWRRQVVRDAQPNAAHDVLARWTRERPNFTLITQNVDGLHERAGAERLIRLHGSIWHVRCSRPCPAGQADWRDETAPFPTLPPRCPHCGGFVRPAVVWFGEPLDPDIVIEAEGATYCNVFLTIGTSAIVYPAAGLVQTAKRRGAFTVEINTEATAASELVDISLRGSASDILSSLADAVR
jgi:NAD-dependent deacetylase